MPGVGTGLGIGYPLNMTTINRGWSPLQIPGLMHWTKADAVVQANATPFTNWPDSSGNGRNFTPMGTAPTYYTDLRDGLPGIEFDGTVAMNTAVSFSPKYFVAVGKWKAPSNYSGMLGGAAYIMMLTGMLPEIAENFPGSVTLNGVQTNSFPGFPQMLVIEAEHSAPAPTHLIGSQVGGANYIGTLFETMSFANRPSPSDLIRLRLYLKWKWLSGQSDRDADAYAARLLASGGANLVLSGEIVYLKQFAKELYTQAGYPVDFYPMRSIHNMGTGTSVFSFLGATATLAGGATWYTDGIIFSAAASYMNLTKVISGAKSRTYLVDIKPLVNANFNQQDVLTFGAESGNQWSSLRISNQASSMHLFHHALATAIGPYVTPSYGTRRMIGATYDGSTTRLFTDGVMGVSGAQVLDTAVNPGRVAQILYGGYDGVASFLLAESSLLSDAAIANIYASYRTTIGRSFVA